MDNNPKNHRAEMFSRGIKANDIYCRYITTTMAIAVDTITKRRKNSILNYVLQDIVIRYSLNEFDSSDSSKIAWFGRILGKGTSQDYKRDILSLASSVTDKEWRMVEHIATICSNDLSEGKEVNLDLFDFADKLL